MKLVDQTLLLFPPDMSKAAARQFCLVFLSWLRLLWQGKLFRSGLRRLKKIYFHEKLTKNGIYKVMIKTQFVS